jgi:hypothetical protein
MGEEDRQQWEQELDVGGYVCESVGIGNDNAVKSFDMSLTSLTRLHFSEKARLAREPPLRKVRRLPGRVTMTASVAGPSQQRRVVIDGVTFEFDKDGQRLKRIGGERGLGRAKGRIAD